MKSLLQYRLFMKSLKCISVSIFLLIVSTHAVHSQTYQPITVTGLSHDVVANGSGSPAASQTRQWTITPTYCLKMGINVLLIVHLDFP